MPLFKPQRRMFGSNCRTFLCVYSVRPQVQHIFWRNQEKRKKIAFYQHLWFYHTKKCSYNSCFVHNNIKIREIRLYEVLYIHICGLSLYVLCGVGLWFFSHTCICPLVLMILVHPTNVIVSKKDGVFCYRWAILTKLFIFSIIATLRCDAVVLVYLNILLITTVVSSNSNNKVYSNCL